MQILGRRFIMTCFLSCRRESIHPTLVRSSEDYSRDFRERRLLAVMLPDRCQITLEIHPPPTTVTNPSRRLGRGESSDAVFYQRFYRRTALYVASEFLLAHFTDVTYYWLSNLRRHSSRDMVRPRVCLCVLSRANTRCVEIAKR